MNNQKKVKLLIAFAMLIVVALFVTVVAQIVNISKTQNKLANQQQQIEKLEKELDYYKNKLPNEDYEEIV